MSFLERVGEAAGNVVRYRKGGVVDVLRFPSKASFYTAYARIAWLYFPARNQVHSEYWEPRVYARIYSYTEGLPLWDKQAIAEHFL